MADDADRAQAVLDHAMANYQRRQPAISLRLKSCRECGTSIPTERLSIAPYAIRCLPCQRRYEVSHGRR